MTIRKTVGWVIFAALMLVILIEVPGVASRACYRAGSKFYAAGKYQAAATAFNGSVFLDRRFAQGYIELGSSYVALKKYGWAEKAYLKAKDIADDSCAACGLGMTYKLLGRHDDAEKQFQRAITLDPNDTCAYRQAGIMYYDLGRYPEAIAAFKRALALKPAFGTYYYLANSHVYAREYEAAVDAYKKAIQLDAKDVDVRRQLAIAYDYLLQWENAAAEYKQIIKLEPDNESAHYSLALDYLALHNDTAALEQYEILRKINPDLASELVEDMFLSEKRQRGKEKLYFVPLNNFPAASVTKLVNFCKQKLGIQAMVAQPIPFVLSTVDKRRQQVIAEEAIRLMKNKYPSLTADSNAIIIGLTDEDMYIRNEDWQYAFNYRAHGRFGVVSTARMNPVNVGGAADEALTEARIRKVVLKNIGLLYYVYPINHNPTSVLYGDVGGVEDLDKMGEDF